MPFAGPFWHCASAPLGESRPMSVDSDALLACLPCFWRMAKMPALIRAVCCLARRSDAANPLAADVISSSPLRASTVEPIGTDATPLSGMKPPSCFRLRPGSLTKTSPDSARTTAVFPGAGGTLPGGSRSHASPTPSSSSSDWLALALAGQLSVASRTPSPSASVTGEGGGGGGGGGEGEGEG